MTVILVLAMFAAFVLFDWFTGKKPIMTTGHDVRLFDHTGDQFASLGVTAADGGEEVKRCPHCGR